MSRAVTFAFLLIGPLFGPVQGHAQDMASYTAYPPYVANSVTPNILFMVDLSEAMLAAAYGNYPESSGGKISGNVNGTGLCNTNPDTTSDTQPTGCASVDV
ncbi:MAG: hypothetical protein O7E49_12475, partial [Gemmatimonadetes bacterium]|nr:hypothetical protein [Gemmatimonadota bacterium]